jgi:hypothetical protein
MKLLRDAGLGQGPVAGREGGRKGGRDGGREIEMDRGNGSPE